MKPVRRGYAIAVAGLALLGLGIALRAGAADDVIVAEAGASQAGVADAVDHTAHRDADLGRPEVYLTINVALTDDAMQPSSIFVPLGRRVRLVVRNRGSSEHHYRVVGLVPKDLLWLAQDLPGESAASTITDEHADHHEEISFVPFRFASMAGVRPTGNEVHAYALPGELDAVSFTATKTGTFSVRCPLHPRIVGTLTVFSTP